MALSPLQDILVDIHYLDLGYISGIYKDHEQICFASACLSNAFRIKIMYPRCPITFMSPLELWKEDGTFFVKLEFDSCCEIGIFTPHLHNIGHIHDMIYSALHYTRRIDFESSAHHVIFKYIHRSLYYVIMAFVHARQIEVVLEEKYYILTLKKEKSLEFEVVVPIEVVLIPLKEENARVIASNLPHRWSREYISNTIKYSGGYGIFSRHNGELLSWGLKTTIGTIGFVHTVAKARRRSYASTIVKKLAIELAREELHTAVTIQFHEDRLFSFFKALGFRTVGICHTIHLQRKSVNFSEKIRQVTETTAQRFLKSFSKTRQLITDVAAAGPSWSSGPAYTPIPSTPFDRTIPIGGAIGVFRKRKFKLDLLTRSLASSGEKSRNIPQSRPVTQVTDSSSSTSISQDSSTDEDAPARPIIKRRSKMPPGDPKQRRNK